MEQPECLERVRSADSLLLLALEQPDQVPNKVYEYLGTRRPILAIADAKGETAQMLHLAGGHRVIPKNDGAAIAEALTGLLSNREEDAASKQPLLEEWTTENQMKRLIEAVGGLDVS